MLTKAQQNILAALRSVPAKDRVNGRSQGLIHYAMLDSYDQRSVNGLFKKKYLSHTPYGVAILWG